MPSRQASITAYQNRNNRQKTSGNTLLSDVQQHRDSATILQDLDMSPTNQPSSNDQTDQSEREIGMQSRSRAATTRADSIAAYLIRQGPPQPDTPSDVITRVQNGTSATMTEGRDTMPSTDRWPSHARICRTRPEDEGKKFGRGVLKGLKAANRHYENGSERLPIEFSTRLGGAIGVNYRTFTDEVVIFMKRHAPLIGVKKWADIHDDVKKEIVVDTLKLWDLEDTPENSRKILTIANERYRAWRSTLHATYKCYNTDDLRRRNKPDDVGEEEWEHLIEYFGTDAKFQEKSRKNSDNRKKRKSGHNMGSKSYSQLSYEKRNPETGEEPDDIELWELSHLKNGVWSSIESQAVHESACTVVAAKERKDGQSASMEERNDIFHTACRSTLGTTTSYVHGRGYMARPPKFFQSLRSQMTEQVLATSETQRQNEELRHHVQNLQDRNVELNQHVHDLEEQNKELGAQVQTLGNKNDDLNTQVLGLEGQIASERTDRVKEMDSFRESMNTMRQEMLKMIGNQSSSPEKTSEAKNTQRNSNGSTGQGTKDQSFQVPGARIVSSHRLRETVRKKIRP